MNDVKIDSREVDQLLDNLADTDLMNKIIFEAVKAGAKVLQENTKKSFRAEMGGVASNISRYTRKPFEDGIIVSTETDCSEKEKDITQAALTETISSEKQGQAVKQQLMMQSNNQ